MTKDQMKYVIKAYKQVLKQAGRLVVDIPGLIDMGEVIKKQALELGYTEEEYNEGMK